MQVSQKKAFQNRAVLYAMTFIMGGCGMAYEYTFSKISSDLMGNSVRQWAVTIGLMMFFMGIGSDLQKHLKDRFLFDKFIFFEVLLGLIGGFGPILLLVLFGTARDHYVLVQYGLIIGTGFLIGLEIPILARINERFTSDLRVNIGGILRMDYVGSFLGAMCWVFLFLRFFSLTQIGFVLGLFNTLVALLSLYYFRELTGRPFLLTSFACLASLALAVGFDRAPQWTFDTTKYQHIVLTQSEAGDLFCYINGNTQFSSFDEHIYHEFLVHPAMQVAPVRKKVLVLGGGDGLAVREILKYHDVESVTLVDLDPGMTELATHNEILRELNDGSLSHAKVQVLEGHGLVEVGQEPVGSPDRTELFGAFRDEEELAEVTVVNIDAAVFLDRIRGVYDVIVIDFPDPNSIELSKLYSKSFYQKVRAKLSKYGVIVQQSTSPVHAREAFLCVGRTLEAAGFAAVPYHENVPSFGEWGWWVAMRDEVTHPQRLRQRLAEMKPLELPVRYITDHLIRASLHFGKDELVTPHTEINTILNNKTYFYYTDALTRGY